MNREMLEALGAARSAPDLMLYYNPEEPTEDKPDPPEPWGARTAFASFSDVSVSALIDAGFMEELANPRRAKMTMDGFAEYNRVKDERRQAFLVENP